MHSIISTKKVVICILLILECFSTPNYAPAPQVNVSILTTLKKSPIGGAVIGSKRVESLQISQASSKSSFTLTYFNRSAPNNLNTYPLSQDGSWSYIKGTSDTLSCSLAYETTNKVFGFLQFLNDVGVFKMYAKVPLSSLQSIQATQDYTVFSNALIVGENCSYVQLFNVLYSLTGTGQALNQITLPSGFSFDAYTESFRYVISSSKLYKFSGSLSQYSLIYSLDVFTDYQIYQKNERIIIAASNNQRVAGNPMCTQKTYFFQDEASGLILLSSSDSYTGLCSTVGSRKFIPISTSPTLTKVGILLFPKPNPNNILVKAIDYTANKVIDLIWDDATHMQSTAAGIQQQSEFAVSDSFVVLRNGIQLQWVPAANAFEQGYQIVGNKLKLFNKRQLQGSKQSTDWTAIMIDAYFTQNLVVLDSYKVDSGSQIDQAQFGNYASTTRVIPPVSTPYIQFQHPYIKQSRMISSIPNKFSWITHNFQDKITHLERKDGAPGNLIRLVLTFSGASIYYIGGGLTCQILYDRNKKDIYANTFNVSAGTSTAVNITNLLGAEIKTSIMSSAVITAENCARFAINKNIYYFTQTPNTYAAIENDLTIFKWDAIDSSLTYATVGTQVWKYSSGKYVKYASIPDLNPYPFSVNSFQNRVIIAATNISSQSNGPILAQVFVFVDQNRILTPIYNYTSVLETFPNIIFSENITKFVIYIQKSDNSYFVESFFIDYTQKQATSISFPPQILAKANFLLIFIFERFFYIIIFSTIYEEFVYYLSQDIIPQLILLRDMPQSYLSVGLKKILIVQNDIKNYSLGAETFSINKWVSYVTFTQLNITQASIYTGNNKVVSSYASNGGMNLCSPGCSDCSSTVCTGCKSGFVLDSNSALCLKCPQGCTTCDSTNTQSCSACFNGAYLSGSSCIPCSSACITCSGTPTSCLDCLPGQFYSAASTKCVACGKYCITCKSQALCTQCKKGFIVTPAGECRGCAMSCSECSASDITQCTACGSGLQLVNSQCIQCPSNCLACNKGYCQTCVRGFSLNQALVCTLNCQLPCATCETNKPSQCTSCFGLSVLRGSTCVIDSACNSTSSCTDCGQGLNYYLDRSLCYPCNLINNVPNCIQCNQINQQLCSICQDGYYVTSLGLCASCPTGCISCVGAAYCTTCQTGYTLPSGQTQSQCLQCISPCATCSGTTDYCLSCVAGYTKSGWKCQKDVKLVFSLTLSGTGVDKAQVLANIDKIIAALLKLMGEMLTNIHVISLTLIIQNSVYLAGTITPESVTNKEAFVALSSGLTVGSTLEEYTITSASVSGYSEQTTAKTNVALIVGLTIGLAAFLTILFLAFYYAYKSRQSNEQTPAKYDSSAYLPNQESKETNPGDISKFKSDLKTSEQKTIPTQSKLKGSSKNLMNSIPSLFIEKEDQVF